MFIVHVTPLQKRGVATLTYFSVEELPVGSIVTVPIRKRDVRALVLECEDAHAIKAALRTNVFEMKKLPKQAPQRLCDDVFIRAARVTSDHFATSIGSLVEAYIPSAILADTTLTTIPPTASTPKNAYEKSALQLPISERIEKYRMLIRSNFARGSSTFICAPTTREARTLKATCNHEGISHYVFLLESSQTPKKQQSVWRAILNEDHPVVIIATPTFLSIPRSDIGMYIIDHESSASYKQQRAPYVDARILADNLARERASSLVLADTILSTRVHKDMQAGFVREVEGHARKLRAHNNVNLINTRDARTYAKENKEAFPIVTPEVIEALTRASQQGDRSCVFAPRRGIASSTVCNDCGASVRCSTCKASLTLHELRNGRQLLCHRCGAANDADIRCTTCDSWNLVPLGIGIERVVEYIRLYLPEAPIVVISSDATSTPKQARAAAKEFYETPGAILIGTEMALAYLTEPIALSVMCSIDSLMGIPDFRIEEKLFAIIAYLREHTQDELYIETTNTDNEMLTFAQEGLLQEYIEHELTLRKQLNYPPYAHLIQVSCVGTREKAIADMQTFVEHATDFSPRVFRGFIPRGRNLELRALIRVPTAQWPDKKLLTLLRSLPPSCTVTVNPDKVL